MKYKINKKENLYFALKVIFTVVIAAAVVAIAGSLTGKSVYSSLATLYVLFLYAIVIWLFFIFQKIYLIAYMKGNGVPISERQFPEAYRIYTDMAKTLGLKKIPRLFLIQQGGLLNAFAVRFSGKNYIAVYSEIFSLISSDIEAVKFVLGHELGHVKRNHMSKRFWTFLSAIVPFLNAAYSRSCEYTCDNIGYSFAAGNSMNGLLVLAAGKDLYQKINIKNYIEEAGENNTLAVRFIGLFISHPYLPKRLKNLELI